MATGNSYNGVESSTEQPQKKRKKQGLTFTSNKNKRRAKGGTMHHLHEHPLKVAKSKKLGRWACDGCTPVADRLQDQEYQFDTNDERYSCALNKKPPCDFDLCKDCFKNGINSAQAADSHSKIYEPSSDERSKMNESRKSVSDTVEKDPAEVTKEAKGPTALLRDPVAEQIGDRAVLSDSLTMKDEPSPGKRSNVTCKSAHVNEAKKAEVKNQVVGVKEDHSTVSHDTSLFPQSLFRQHPLFLNAPTLED